MSRKKDFAQAADSLPERPCIICDFFRNFASQVRHQEITQKRDWQEFITTSQNEQWVYVIEFSEAISAWGTASGKGNRFIKSGLLQSNLTGKYDRRGDYMMLKKIYGQPKITVFELSCDATIPEQKLRLQIHGHTGRGSACYIGFQNRDRDGITTEIYSLFKENDAYKRSTDNHRVLFDEFIRNFYLARLRHPQNPKRTFYYGDCMEPNFIRRTLNRPDLADAVCAILGVTC